jgi:glycosyltransferase involved in cell wall biosynthesis
MRLTAIIPNFNHGSLLPRSLGALVRQHRQADEILVIDDASTDDSRDVIRSFSERLPQLRLLENPVNIGVVRTLNRGLQEATGDAVYFGGADDATDPAFFQAVLGALEQFPRAGLACGEARVLTDDGHFVGLRPATMPAIKPGYVSPDQAANLLRKIDNWVLSVVAILRRDVVLAAGGFDESLASFCDSYIERKIALESGFVFVPRVLGTWYVQPQSYSRGVATDPGRMTKLIASVSDRLRQAEGAPFPPGYHEVFMRRAQFASARLALEGRRFDPLRVNALVEGSGMDAAFLRTCSWFPWTFGRLAALAWLTLRLRPTSLPALARSMAHRSLRGSRAIDRVPQ